MKNEDNQAEIDAQQAKMLREAKERREQEKKK